MIYPTESEILARMEFIRAGYRRRYSGKDIRQRLWDAQPQPHICPLGGKPIPDLFFAAVDHYISVRDWASMAVPKEEAEEFANREDNLWLVCRSCNTKKGEADLEDTPQLKFNCSDEPLKLGAEQIAVLKAKNSKLCSIAAKKRAETMGPDRLAAASKKRAETMGPEKLSVIAKKRAETMGPEKLSVIAKKRAETMGPEKLSAMSKKSAKKRAETMGPDRLAVAARKANETRGPEGRRAAAKKGKETMGPERCSAARKKQIETMGPERRSAAAKKAAHTRNHTNCGISDPECEFCQLSIRRISAPNEEDLK
jgi:hypothetical protein